MTTLSVGVSAYKRTVDGSPEIKLVNRYLEKKPQTNPIEKASLLARPGTKPLVNFPASTSQARIRGMFSEKGSFGSDLFVVSGTWLFRYNGTGDPIHITGTVADNGFPRLCFVKGVGYERLFIADGLNLYYYDGGTRSTAMLDVDSTKTTFDFTAAMVAIGGTYYGWTTGGVDANTPDGSRAAPFLTAITTTATQTEAMTALADALNYKGYPGTDFSTAITTANLLVSAEVGADSVTTDPTVALTSRGRTLASNDITVAVEEVGGMLWDDATLTGGADAGQNAAVAATGIVRYHVGTHYSYYELNIGGTWYAWTDGDVDDDGSVAGPSGTEASPYLCKRTEQTFKDMVNMLSFTGTPGTDFSTNLTAADPNVTAAYGTDTDSNQIMTLTAKIAGAVGNSIVTIRKYYISPLTFDADKMSGGGVQALQGVRMPNGEAVIGCESLNQFIFVSIADSQRFYYIRPGETTVDSLDFASKESNPDPIVDIKRVGDMLVIMGTGSTEFWQPTGDNNNPFAPVVGRTLSRGIIDGTAVAVDQSTIVYVGDDFRVYAIHGSPSVISGPSMDERIRRQRRGVA